MNNDERLAGKEIIYSLRNGVVPQRFLSQIAIFDNKILTEINDHLSYVKQNHSSIKFICGDYGSGKTFHCHAISEIGIKEGFATSVIDISQGNFNSPVSMYRLLIQNLHVSDKRNTSAISDILEKWLYGLQKKIEKVDGLKFTGENKDNAVEKLGQIIDNELSECSQKDITLTNVIKSYFFGKINKDERLYSAALKWLKADLNLTNDEKKALGLKKNITDDDVITKMLRVIADIIKKANYTGWVLIFDELTILQKLPNKNQRDDSYEFLRSIIDHIASQDYPYCFFVFAGITKLFEDPRYGIKSNKGLDERITSPDILPDFTSSKEIILKLKGFDAQSITDITRKIIRLHASVYDWKPTDKISDTFINKLSEFMTSGFGGEIKLKPRKVLRDLICFLDKLHENPSLDPNIIIKQNEMELIKNIEES